MGVNCVFCDQKYNPKEKWRSFHVFPNKGSVRHKWIDFIRKHKDEDWVPKTKSVRICSLHFTLNDYELFNLHHPKLKPLAYPTIFDHESMKKSMEEKVAAKRSLISSSGLPWEAVEKWRIPDVLDPLDPPPEKRSKVELSETTSCASSSVTENSTCIALDNFSFKLPAKKISVANTQSMEKEGQNLRTLYLAQQEEVLGLESNQPLQETELRKYKHLKTNLSFLQEKIINWALNAIPERFQITAEQDAQISKFVQSDYCLLKADNKMLKAALASRDQSITNLKGKSKYQDEQFEAKSKKLKTKISDLNDQVIQLKDTNNDLRKEKIILENRMIDAEASHKKQLQLADSLKLQVNLEQKLSDSLLSQATLEEKWSNDHKRLIKSGEELISARRLNNTMIRQMRSKDAKLKSLLELEKGYKLMIKKMKSGKNNLFLKQASAIDDCPSNIEVVISEQSGSPPNFPSASFDLQQDPDGEHSVSASSSHEAAHIMIVVESDDEEQLDDEVSEEEFE